LWHRRGRRDAPAHGEDERCARVDNGDELAAAGRRLHGVEAVIDKDHASALLAAAIGSIEHTQALLRGETGTRIATTTAVHTG
jgi:hypothetical protein